MFAVAGAAKVATAINKRQIFASFFFYGLFYATDTKKPKGKSIIIGQYIKEQLIFGDPLPSPLTAQ